MKHRSYYRPIALAVFFLLTVASGCGSKSGTLSIPPTRGQALWQSRAITSYRYTLTINAFVLPGAAGPVMIEVQNGRTVSVTPVNPTPEFRAS